VHASRVLATVFHRRELFPQQVLQEKIVLVRHQNQHARRVRYPEAGGRRLTKSAFLQLAEIVRNWCLKKKSLSCARMGKSQFPGVQHHARCGGSFPIKRIADHGMTEMMQMDADLVGPSAVQRTFHQAYSTAGLQDAIFRPGRSSTAQIDRHFFALYRMPADRGIDCSAGSFEGPGNEREVDFLDLALGELAGEGLMRRVIFCHRETAAGLFIETMNNPRALLAADAGEAGAVMKQRVDQGMRLVARTRMNDQARRFIQYKEVVVLEKNLEGNFFGLVLDFLDYRLDQTNDIASPDQLPRTCRLPLQPHLTSANQSL
jgi:hypothetical protein